MRCACSAAAWALAARPASEPQIRPAAAHGPPGCAAPPCPSAPPPQNFLHTCKPPIIHRDLKSPNLLVDKDLTVKVGRGGSSSLMGCSGCGATAGLVWWLGELGWRQLLLAPHAPRP